jgi:hypothetical protein
MPIHAIHPLARIALPFVVALLANVSTWGETITTKTIDRGSGGDTGQYTSQAIVNGNTALAYYNVTDGNLMFARNSAVDGSGTWSIVTVDATGNVGQYTSLAVVDGHPAISYYDQTNRSLKYVRANDSSGVSWGPPVVVSSGNSILVIVQDTSLAVVNGNPAISYDDYGRHDLKYVRANDPTGTSWGMPVSADTGYVGSGNFLAVVNGNPVMSYFDADGNLKYVRSNDASGMSWGTPVFVDTTSPYGGYTSLIVVNGNPAISYYAAGSGGIGALKYVRALDPSGTLWGAPVSVDTTGNAGLYTSLAVVNGNPAVSYYDDTNRDLKYVRATDADGTLWGVPVSIDTNGTVGSYTSLVVVDGNPAISYYDQENGNLKYVRALDASGITWPAGAIADSGFESGHVGYYTSQALVNGNPAISYHDAHNAALKYVRANDASGTSWGTPVFADDLAGNVGGYSSLALVNGNPAISYNQNNGTVMYVRASDANGNSWDTSVVVDTIGGLGAPTSLAVVNGNPAISYYDSIKGDLKYVRANDANGTSWGMPIAVDRTGVVGISASLLVVNGNPAISYYDVTNGDLKYVRANDVSGTLWGTAVSVDTTGDVGLFTSLAVVNGKPAISYYDQSQADLKYVRATDASGTSWGTSVSVDTTGNVGQTTSLAVVDGNPAISYYDGISLGDLKYVRANDANGTSWSTPVFVDTAGDVGLYSSLVEVNGKAAISYLDNTKFDLKWATVTPPGAQALNISTRDQVRGGENVLIGGFIITGAAPKKVILRAIGPSIAASDGTLQDPVLELRGTNGSLILRNDNWKDTQQQQIEQSMLVPTDDRESAIVATLNPGAYTMILSGKDGAEGIAVVEAYDLSQSALSELANMSSRGLVQTADNVMIAGFILGGQSTQDSRVAIRGLGPSLGNAGVTNALADPTIDLRDKDGNQIEFNDNYGDNPAEAAELAANGLTPSDPHEAGLFRTFAPGTYTVILAGKGGATGVGLIEVYNLR